MSRFTSAPTVAPLLAGAALLLLPSCLSGNWSRTIVQKPLPEEILAELPQQGIGLARCLALLGSPTFVAEYRVHGLVVAWGWQKDRTFGAQVTGPTQETSALRISYDDVRLRQHGVVLWFDDDWMLTGWQAGYLRDLVGPRPPAPLEDIYGPEPGS